MTYIVNNVKFIVKKGRNPDLNREPTVPHTAALPIELLLPYSL